MDKEKIVKYLREKGEKFEMDFPMKFFTSMKVGGPADVVYYPTSVEDLVEFLKTFKEYKNRFYILGEGTNVIVRDGGIRGVVISLKNLRGMEVKKANKNFTIKIIAGEPLPALVKKGMELGFRGVEKLAGIPGTVGGAVAGNAGLDKKGISEFVKGIRIVTFSGRNKVFSKEDLSFSYRMLKMPVTGIIVEVTMEFTASNPEKVKEKVIQKIKSKSEVQPLNIASAGSIFKNPPGRKAWKLIEDAGLRGLRLRGARVSEKHANFIVNEKNATARDIETLVDLIKLRVKKVFGIELEEEIKFIGVRL